MEDNFDNVPQEQNIHQETDQNAEQNTQQDNAYQYSYGNNQYQSYNYNSNNGQDYNMQEDTSVMSMGDWLITLLAMLIPCAGIILYLVWAFGKNGNANRRNYCRAYLIYWAITTVLTIIAVVLFSGAIFSMTGNYYY